MSEKTNVLVVDDEPAICEILRRALESEGYDVSIADDGSIGLDMLTNDDFDLIITDERMPNVSGTVLMETSRKKGVAAPFILITGFPSDQLEQHAKDTGAAFLAKPFSMDQLKETLYAVMGKGSGKGDCKELVCVLLGLKFYSSPAKARLLKARVTDLLLAALGNEGLLAVDVRPSVDLTPTFTTVKNKSKSRRQKSLSLPNIPRA